MEVDDIFRILKADTNGIFGGFKIYNQLFESQETVDILNACGSTVFFTYQNSFLDSCILFISRMTDPASTSRNDNLSLKSLISKLPAGCSELEERMLKEISSINQAIRAVRSKRIAHCDTDVRSGKSVLEPIEFLHIKDGLDAIAETLNMYEIYMSNSSTMYSEITLPLGSDGSYLLNRLKKSEAYVEIERSGGCEINMWKSAFSTSEYTVPETT